MTVLRNVRNVTNMRSAFRRSAGGNIVGEHEVIFAGTDEVITFKHTAYSKAIFGKGAIEAAKYLAGKPAGFYGMADVIKSAS